MSYLRFGQVGSRVSARSEIECAYNSNIFPRETPADKARRGRAGAIARSYQPNAWQPCIGVRAARSTHYAL